MKRTKIYTSEQAKQMNLFVDAFNGRVRELKKDKSRHYLVREFFLNQEDGSLTMALPWKRVRKAAYEEIMDLSVEFRKLATKLFVHLEISKIKTGRLGVFEGGFQLSNLYFENKKEKQNKTLIDEYHLDALIYFYEKYPKANMYNFLKEQLTELTKLEGNSNENITATGSVISSHCYY